jgi:cation diffusion facilitator CzcD-associated flavoprotein CzcO
MNARNPFPDARSVHDVAIIGAGFAGLGTAIRLREAGVTDIVVLERDARPGGTWRDNQYPGAACDIPSQLYSFSFAPKPDWSRAFAGSREILDYLDSLLDDHDLRPLLRCGCDVQALRFDEVRGYWQLSMADGATLQARAVVAAQGPLSNASLPNIRGIADFEGHKIHSARWDHDYDLTGKRVAVIGTGASAVQIVPELVKTAASVKVFQRTPGWVLPRPDRRAPVWQKALFRRLPRAQRAVREALFWGHEAGAVGIVWNTPVTRALEALGRAHIRHHVKDRWLRRQLTPDYRIGCKRVLLSSDYYSALMQENCKLITWPIATIAPKGIRTAEGIEHQVDCIVFATGFDVCKQGAPFSITGVGGRRLEADWARAAQAYKSVSVAGYPNLFLTMGPNAGPGHNSALVYMEAQIDYIVQGIGMILGQDLHSLDVRPDAQARYNQRIQKRLARTNWNSGCSSWYLTEDGFNATMYPGFATAYRRQMQRFAVRDYVAQRAGTACQTARAA